MKEPKVAVHIRDIHKEFVLPQSKHTSMKQAAVNIIRKNNKVTQKVLDGVSFDINRGDFFGIVGRNGSGKSTLLKLIAGVYYPTKGSIQVNGGITPFIELGVGFNSELSGRDNVHLNGALLGFNRSEMDDMYDEIVDFAELGPFMDQKLKNYSSGMQVRLAFSIAIKAKSDVLIFDEVLAVGDEAFQQKCLDVFESYKASGQTVVLVTHDMNTVRKFCNRAVLLKGGKVIEDGSPQEVATKYSELNHMSTESEMRVKNANNSTSQDSKALSVHIERPGKGPAETFQLGDTIRIRLKLKEGRAENVESVGMTIIKQSGEHIGGINSQYSAKGWNKKNDLVYELPLTYAPGKYWILGESFSGPGRQIESVVGPSFEITYKGNIEWSGLTPLMSKWIDEGEK